MAMQSLPDSSQFKLFNWPRMIAFAMLGFICLSLILIIQVQHKVRHLETRYAKALQDEVDLREEFGKLTLEEHHLTALARVEDIARTKLHMTLEKTPDSHHEQTIFLSPVGTHGDDKTIEGASDAAESESQN
ncbi:MAG: cell division protein FtsL [Hydrogenovibrio sp.]|nr:cell division protein FtsL [Hydrogenovibrio sp.]